MSNQKHTPEPWVIRNNYWVAGQSPILDICSGEEEICTLNAYGFKRSEVEQVHENAARIVACVNHCKGATNEELEAKSYEELKAQRDELIAALEMACTVMMKDPACQFTFRTVKAKLDKIKGGTHE